MEAFLKRLSLLVHWVCFAIGVAVIIAVIIYNADLDTLFISMAIGFSIVSIIVGAAIKWMFSGNFSLFPWKS
ncbi:MAG: hypothetical protein DBW94_06380 [Gammaproteobacteria bacterium]|jgi:hypothetical protein|nr:MAG: hypothetical protein DBW94_06380 [Gammaproteobacteria bacterium]|tara:strand:+ start:751 stop:966 length:216 start_codon:yes stop_codon:yes gene_type:complete